MLPTIPSIDLRNGGSLIDALMQDPERARSLINASKDAFGIASRAASAVALPVGDAIAKRWLHNTNNPYAAEIDAFASAVGIPGVYALNLSYEWGCSSGVFEAEHGPLMLRVLDWPFPALGAHMTVHHLKNTAGEWVNAGWPAVSGVYQAIAPGRFSAAINLAPMRRHLNGVVMDWTRNRFHTFRSKALPPSHLLRQVFETARDYNEAKERLATTPLMLPVLFVLAGTKPGEGCVIERLENDAVIREMTNGKVGTSNHFQSRFNGIGRGWMPRAIESCGRAGMLMQLDPSHLEAEGLDWFKYPIANIYSRVLMTASPVTGRMRLQGLEGEHPVTEVFSL